MSRIPLDDSAVDDRGHHLDLLDRLADRVPHAVTLEPEIAGAVGMDPHDGAEVVDRLPERRIARLAEIDAIVLCAHVGDRKPELPRASLQLLERPVDVLHRQREASGEAAGMLRHPLGHAIVGAAVELGGGRRVGPGGALDHGARRDHVDVDAQPVHVGRSAPSARSCGGTWPGCSIVSRLPGCCRSRSARSGCEPAGEPPLRACGRGNRRSGDRCAAWTLLS